MNPVENIKKIFSKNFVEHPLLETYEAGYIHISSGFIVSCDPLISTDHSTFNQQFPKGNYTVNIYKEMQSNCIAYAEVVFDNNKIVENWKLALCENQNIKDLNDEEIFGFPVESGMGCFMDRDAQNVLNRLEKKLYDEKGEAFLGIYEEFFHSHFFNENGQIDQFSILIPESEKKQNIVAFETGYGEGFYASYIGYSKDNQVVKLISEFIEVGMD